MPDNNSRGMTDQAARLQQSIIEIEAEIVAEDGAVKVIAGAGGQVRKIDLGWQALQLSAAELGQIVTEALRASEQAVEAQTQIIVSDILGERFMALSDQSKGRSE